MTSQHNVLTGINRKWRYYTALCDCGWKARAASEEARDIAVANHKAEQEANHG